MKYKVMHNPDHPSGQDMEFIFEMDKGIISTIEVARRLNAAEQIVETLGLILEPLRASYDPPDPVHAVFRPYPEQLRRKAAAVEKRDAEIQVARTLLAAWKGPLGTGTCTGGGTGVTHSTIWPGHELIK